MKRVVICDLDNTLYDWVAYFVPAFYAMVDAVVALTNCDKEQLLDDFREVHQRASNSEEPFALLQTKTMRRVFAHATQQEMLRALDPAFHAFNSTRKRTLTLYPHVNDTLDALSQAGVRLIAHTESKLFNVVDRLRRLDLTRHFSKIYCRERSDPLFEPTIERTDWFEAFPLEKIVELSRHQAKPNASVLREICSREGILIDEGAYVGDSLAKDVAMAKRVGLFAIWAQYGSKHDRRIYEALVRISHWTPDEVERERKLSREALGVTPDYIARDSFAEVLVAVGVS